MSRTLLFDHSEQALLPDLLTNREASQIFGVSPATLKLSRHTGKLGGVKAPRFYKLGRNVRYKTTDVFAWLNQFTSYTSTSSYNVSQQQ